MTDPGSTTPDVDAPAQQMPRIRGYRVRRVINHGGMATVYLAQQLAPPRDVAVKVLSEHTVADEVSLRRFENEVRTIARLTHPNIVQIHELGRTDDGVPYYSMQYLSRGHLGQRRFVRADGGVDEAKVIGILRALLSALGYAHTRGIVHRDVKAENVLFDEREQPMLADFGIALRRGFGTRVTAVGLAVGTTAYMAPEQARGQEVDARADLYSVGVLAWEMLAGELPYRSGDALSMAMLHTQAPIPKLPGALRHWQRFMNTAMAKAPRARYDNVAAMLHEIDAIESTRRWPRLPAPAIGPLATRVRDWSRSAIGMATLVVSGIAIAVAVFAGRDMGDSGFFRAQPRDQVSATSSAIDSDPVDSMFEPLPESPVQTHIDVARALIRQRNLTAPEGANAFASTLTAWQVDRDDPLVRQMVGELAAAFSAELVTHLRAGNDAKARDYLQHAERLERETGITGTAPQLALRAHAGNELKGRMKRAVADRDRDDAQVVAELAVEFGLPADMVRRLREQGEAIPRIGQALPKDPTGAVLVKGRIALSPHAVTRGEYGQFVAATGRASSICRERVSLLRIVKPRDWKSPGFTQGDRDPAVCVSPADADAYARWLSARTGYRYRLPGAVESTGLPARIGGPVNALWLRECGATCAQRRATGATAARAANRGYENVSFRLVRDL